jgi:phosphoenolpyruvate phosphomutase
MKRTTRLRSLVNSPYLEFMIEAHNGLSAFIAEDAGFKAIWASGFAISASLGLPDNNEASFSEILQVVEYMADKTSLPILMDGDSGFGDYNNMRRLVRKIEQRGVAGVCIEDKNFPKRNSFVRGNRQPLASIEEFCGKIKAGKDSQLDPDFLLVARIEAFIAGWGLDEALKRADAYAAAGADAILIHSAKRSAEEVLAFKAAWGNRLPVVVVPTKYYATPTEVLEDAGFSICIWANHLMRASVTAMQRVARQIYEDRNLFNAETSVAPLNEIFRIQGEPEREETESRYLPTSHAPMVILLAASRSDEFGDLTRDIPKTMLKIGGRPILDHILSTYHALGLSDIIVVRGFSKEAVTLDGPIYVDNDAYETSGEAWSLWQARQWLTGQCIIGYGDVIFHKHIPALALDCNDDFVICVDPQWREEQSGARAFDLVVCSEPNFRGTYYRRVVLKEIRTTNQDYAAHGEWMGILRISARGSKLLLDLLERFYKLGTLRNLSIPDLLTVLLDEGQEVRVLYTTGHWLDIDSITDLITAGQYL